MTAIGSRDVRIQCSKCSAWVTVSSPASQAKAGHFRGHINELLVDFGWLPTTQGALCPQHSRQLRRLASAAA